MLGFKSNRVTSKSENVKGTLLDSNMEDEETVPEQKTSGRRIAMGCCAHVAIVGGVTYLLLWIMMTYILGESAVDAAIIMIIIFVSQLITYPCCVWIWVQILSTGRQLQFREYFPHF